MPSLLRGVTLALVPVYVVGLKAYLVLFDSGIRKRGKLAVPVVSIGNLTTGGTGKTPMAQTLTRLLVSQGLKVALLSRGYGGKNEYGCAIVSDGKKTLLNSEEAGDEAHLLAKTLKGTPVLVGKDRRVSGKIAVEEFAPDVILLDDGMQVYPLERDLDIVLINAADPFDNGYPFPRGLLREPVSHLKRADIILLTNVRHAGAKATGEIQRRAQLLAPDTPIFTADLVPTGLKNLVKPERFGIEWLDGRRVASLCAVGNPASFESLIGELGGVLASRFRFRDHQTMTMQELETVFREACASGAEAVIITEKDAVKMPPLKSPIPIYLLLVEMKVDGETAFLHTVMDRIRYRLKPVYKKGSAVIAGKNSALTEKIESEQNLEETELTETIEP